MCLWKDKKKEDEHLDLDFELLLLIELSSNIETSNQVLGECRIVTGKASSHTSCIYMLKNREARSVV